jgi:hypothetical protein
MDPEGALEARDMSVDLRCPNRTCAAHDGDQGCMRETVVLEFPTSQCSYWADLQRELHAQRIAIARTIGSKAPNLQVRDVFEFEELREDLEDIAHVEGEALADREEGKP